VCEPSTQGYLFDLWLQIMYNISIYLISETNVNEIELGDLGSRIASPKMCKTFTSHCPSQK